MNNLKKAWFENMYSIKLNGIAIAGWIVSSLYGTFCLIRELFKEIFY